MKTREIVIEINTTNAAFEGANKGPEIARILRTLAEQMEQGSGSGGIRDINGKTCGLIRWYYTRGKRMTIRG